VPLKAEKPHRRAASRAALIQEGRFKIKMVLENRFSVFRLES
jgi:hypothetical protein